MKESRFIKMLAGNSGVQLTVLTGKKMETRMKQDEKGHLRAGT